MNQLSCCRKSSVVGDTLSPGLFWMPISSQCFQIEYNITSSCRTGLMTTISSWCRDDFLSNFEKTFSPIARSPAHFTQCMSSCQISKNLRDIFSDHIDEEFLREEGGTGALKCGFMLTFWQKRDICRDKDHNPCFHSDLPLSLYEILPVFTLDIEFVLRSQSSQ